MGVGISGRNITADRKYSTRRFSRQSLFAFISLSSFLLFFYIMMIYEAAPLVKTLLLIGVLLLAEGLYFVKIELGFKGKRFENDFAVLISVTLASIVTFVISVKGAGPVIAAAAVGLVYGIVSEGVGKDWKSLSAPVYCGAFVGMSFELIFTQLWMVALAGLIAGIVYVIAKEVFVGIGGKMGTIAFIGSLIAKMLTMFM